VAPNGARVRYTVIERKKVGETSVLHAPGSTSLPVVAYPNPAIEGVWIALPETSPVLLRLYNSIGQVVWERKAEGDGLIYIPRQGLPGGVYRMQVQGVMGIGTAAIVFE